MWRIRCDTDRWQYGAVVTECSGVSNIGVFPLKLEMVPLCDGGPIDKHRIRIFEGNVEYAKDDFFAFGTHFEFK